MTCRDIPAAAVGTYDTIQQMFIGLGVRRLPSGIHKNASGNLPTGGLNLGVLTPESVACFNTLTGIRGGSVYNGSALHTDIRELRQLVDYFKTTGNTGDANVITGDEIDRYVTAYGAGNADFNAQEYRDLTVANLQSYVGIVDYVGGDTPAEPEAAPAADPLTDAIRSYGSIQQMFIGLMGDVTGTANATRSSVSEEIPAEGIQLGALTEANLQQFKTAIGWAGETPTSPLASNAKEILDLVTYFRDGGNLNNGDAEVVTGAEIDAYVRGFVQQARNGGDRSITFDNFRPVVVGNLRSFVACVQYVSHPTGSVTETPDAGAPSQTADAGANPSPADASAPDAAPVDADIVFEAEDASAYDTAMTNTDAAQVPEVPEAAETETDAGSEARRHRPGHHNQGWSWGGSAILAGVSALFGLVGGYLLWGRRGSGNNPTPTPSQTPLPRSGGIAPAPRRPAAPAIESTNNDMQEAIDALTTSVLLHGPDAQPANAIDTSVVRAQIVLRCRNFMSLAARTALSNNQPLPVGTALVDSHFAQQVQEMTNAVVAEYNRLNTSNAQAIREMWVAERTAGLPITHRGVPDRLLMEVLRPRLEEMGRAAATPEAATLVIRMEEARDHFANRENLEHAFREILRHGR